MLHGLESAVYDKRSVRAPVLAGQTGAVVVNLDEGRFSVPAAGHWVSSDVHVHMNYGGVYRNTPAHLVLQAQAESLGLVNSLIVNKEQRFPDIIYNGARHRSRIATGCAGAARPGVPHTVTWGHLGLLGIDAVILPGYAGYPNTAAASLYPMNADVADLAHARGAVVGYVHAFDDEPKPITAPREVLTNELPVDVALGKV